jgi:peptidoglycan/xylan/chitin deacetylase (PgdA/CDA1 family)
VTDLRVGVVPDGSAYDHVLTEMLDHQGIAYRMMGSQGAEDGPYAAVLLARYSEKGYSEARRHCDKEADIVIAERELPMERLLLLLSGSVDERRDNFDLEVNKSEEILLSLVKERFFGSSLPLVRKWYWPKGSKACFVMSHDIDWFRYSPFHKQVLRQSSNPARLAGLALGSVALRKDYGWNIPEMIRLEKESGASSTFFFQTQYGPDDVMLEKSAKLLRKEEGFEIALHGSHGSHKDPTSLRDELQMLESKTGVRSRGVRYHILKFYVPLSWEIQCDAGLVYDATFYYNEYFGFRSGTCMPFRPISNGSKLPILELPTAYMDWTALHQELSAGEQIETIEKTRKLIESYNGAFVANFHNTYLNEGTFPGIYRSYRGLLKTVKEENYWIATASECAEWWYKRTAAQTNPRLESGEILVSKSEVDTIVEKEGRDEPTMLSAKTTV